MQRFPVALVAASLGLFGFAIPAWTQEQTPSTTSPAANASGQYAGTGQGNLTVDGKPIPMKYAYAVLVDDVETAGLPLSYGPTKTIILVLSDIPLPKKLVENRSAPDSDVKSIGQYFDDKRVTEASKMRGLQFEIDAEKKAVLKYQIKLPGAGASYDSGAIGPEYQLKNFTVTNGIVSGTILVSEAKTHPSASVAEAENNKKYKGPKKFQFRVTFTAPLQTEPPVTKVYDGAEALNNEQINVLKQYAAAANKGDMAAVKRLTAASHHHYLALPGAKEGLKEMKPELLAKEVKRVVVRGNQATVMVVSSGGGSQVMIRMTRENDGWKLYFP